MWIIVINEYNAIEHISDYRNIDHKNKRVFVKTNVQLSLQTPSTHVKTTKILCDVDTMESSVQVTALLSRKALCEMRHLWFLHRCIVLVTHGTYLHAPLPLAVSLAEELLHYAVRPLAVQLQWLCRVAQVRTVHHILEDLKQTNAFSTQHLFLFSLFY